MSSTQFSEQEFGKRLDGMGDLAEGVFENWCGVNYVRFGLNRPPPSHVEVAAAD